LKRKEKEMKRNEKKIKRDVRNQGKSKEERV